MRIKNLALAMLFITLGGCSTLSGHRPAITSSINPSQLHNFNEYPPATQKLIHEALNLSSRHLTYTFGSANPANRGMDCSGAIYYLLRQENIREAPRSSDAMYKWVAENGHIHRVHTYSVKSPQLAGLKPGDLLFWTGTYRTHVKRHNAITHVMMYLGKNKNGEPLIFGSSEGQPYRGRRMRGVSVYDFTLPEPGDRVKFVGYGCIPSLTCA